MFKLITYKLLLAVCLLISTSFITNVESCEMEIVHQPSFDNSASTHDYQNDLPLNRNITNPWLYLSDPSLDRVKRAISVERHIELLVVVDSSMYEYHGVRLENYMQTLIASVSHIFKHPSIGNAITIKLLGIYLLFEDDRYIVYDTPHTLLRSFCNWQHDRNHPSDKHMEHHDTALLITRKKLCGTLKPCAMVGLANVGTICGPENSCFIVEDTGLSSAFTIAHELGHVLGIPHDDQDQCKKFYADRKKQKKAKHIEAPKKANIMASVQKGINRIWAWSACSRHFINNHLRTDGKCLLELQKRDEIYDAKQRFSGRFYDVDQQCNLRFEKSSVACKRVDVCSRLWCSNGQKGCMSDNSPWADGTTCGDGRWCYEGECVKIGDSLKPVDGGWSRWGPWDECSKPCGKGIQESKRKCNNPRPKNGGHYCLGTRVRTQQCNAHSCKKDNSKKSSKKFESKISKKKFPKKSWSGKKSKKLSHQINLLKIKT